LIFRHAGNEVFRLRGVSRPEVFRHVCLTARNALVDIRSVMLAQPAA
jgi:hypothetical protein